MNEAFLDNHKWLNKQENGSNHYVSSTDETDLSSIWVQIYAFYQDHHHLVLPSSVSRVYCLKLLRPLRSFNHGFCKLQEGRFHIARVFGRRFAEGGVERVCVFLSHCGCYFFFLCEIVFVSNDTDRNSRFCEFQDFFVPGFHIFKGFLRMSLE